MKSFLKISSLFSVFYLIILCQSFAQFGMDVSPRESQRCGIYQTIGYTEIEIKYSSPFVKGRKIWGDLVPFDQVWRAGANNATTISFSDDVEINGHPLPAGKYSYFIIPKAEKRWELIFNKIHDQWGAFKYDAREDILRVETLPVKNAFHENLIYTVETRSPEFGQVFLNWDQLKVGFEVKTNHLEVIKKAVVKAYDKALPLIKWVAYVEGADYLIKHNADKALIENWVKKAEDELALTGDKWEPEYLPKEYISGHLFWLRATLLADKKKYKEALALANKMKALEAGYLFYPTQKEAYKIDEQMEDWASK